MDKISKATKEWTSSELCEYYGLHVQPRWYESYNSICPYCGEDMFYSPDEPQDFHDTALMEDVLKHSDDKEVYLPG